MYQPMLIGLLPKHVGGRVRTILSIHTFFPSHILGTVCIAISILSFCNLILHLSQRLLDTFIIPSKLPSLFICKLCLQWDSLFLLLAQIKLSCLVSEFTLSKCYGASGLSGGWFWHEAWCTKTLQRLLAYSFIEFLTLEKDPV